MASKSIRGLYIIEGIYSPTSQYYNPSGIDFGDFEDRGLTDIIITSKYLLSDYSRCKTILNKCIAQIETTNINCNVIISQFRDADALTRHDPNDETKKATIRNAVTNLISDLNIQGISMDDYYYPRTFYDPNQEATQHQTLIDFASDMHDTVKGVDNNCKFSAAMHNPDWRAATMSSITPFLDFVIPMCYRYSVTTADLISRKVNQVIDLNLSIPITPALITYKGDSNRTIWGYDMVMNDVHSIIKKDIGGYFYFTYPFSPSNIFFPDGLIYKGFPFRQWVNRTSVSRRSRT